MTTLLTEANSYSECFLRVRNGIERFGLLNSEPYIDIELDFDNNGLVFSTSATGEDLDQFLVKLLHLVTAYTLAAPYSPLQSVYVVMWRGGKAEIKIEFFAKEEFNQVGAYVKFGTQMHSMGRKSLQEAYNWVIHILNSEDVRPSK